jgi:hypothetical protein
MKLILPANTKVISFDDGDVALEDLKSDAKVAVVRDGQNVFSSIVKVGDGSSLEELIEIRLLSGQNIRLPRGTVVVLSNGGGRLVENVAVGRRPSVEDWKNTQDHTVERQFHAQTQTIEVKGRPIPGSDLLATWTFNVLEIPRELVTVDLAVPCRTIEVDLDDVDALAIVGDRPGMDPDGILVRENF